MGMLALRPSCLHQKPINLRMLHLRSCQSLMWPCHTNPVPAANVVGCEAQPSTTGVAWRCARPSQSFAPVCPVLLCNVKCSLMFCLSSLIVASLVGPNAHHLPLLLMFHAPLLKDLCTKPSRTFDSKCPLIVRFELWSAACNFL